MHDYVRQNESQVYQSNYPWENMDIKCDDIVH